MKFHFIGSCDGSALNLNRLEAQVAGMEEDNVDWDPDDVNVIQGEWHPQALELLQSTGDFAKYKESEPSGLCACSAGPGRAEAGVGEGSIKGGVAH